MIDIARGDTLHLRLHDRGSFVDLSLVIEEWEGVLKSEQKVGEIFPGFCDCFENPPPKDLILTIKGRLLETPTVGVI